MSHFDEIEILLVDDSAEDVELTLRSLKKGNLLNRVEVARDGAEALDFLFGRGKHADRAGAPPPRLVLLDLKMPRVDGLEVLREVKSVPHTKTIPIVVLTSSKEEPDVAAAYALGANGYIVKPVGFEAFVQAITAAGMFWLAINQPPPPPRG